MINFGLYTKIDHIHNSLENRKITILILGLIILEEINNILVDFAHFEGCQPQKSNILVNIGPRI